MKDSRTHRINEVINSVFHDRKRTNLLRKQEQRMISRLLPLIPEGMTSDMLTGIGLLGNTLVAVSFVLAAYIDRTFLLVGLTGFIMNWFGDSLDGRLAYYRNKPKKNYGFALDITIDWISIILIGLGYIIYAEGVGKLFGYGFVALYGWEMIIALIRYKITGKYSIDAGIIGPTEVRIIISLIMITEVIRLHSLLYSAGIIVVVLFVVNISETRKLLLIAQEMDKKEKNEKG